MDHIQRLIFGCLVSFMAWLPASSFAAVTWSAWWGHYAGAPTAEAACQMHIGAAGSDSEAWNPAIIYAISGGITPGTTMCVFSGTINNSYPYSGSVNITSQGTADAPVVCTLPKVLDALSNTCKTPAAANCDWAKGQTQMVFGTFQIERGKELCSSGCGFSLKADAGVSPESSRLNATSPWMDTRTMGDFSGTGSVCASSTTGATTGTTTPSPFPPGEDGTPPKDTCPTGKIGGTVNGRFICVTPGETVTAKKAETTNNDGTDTKKDTVQKSTNCVGASCTTTTNTTTTTTNNSSGTVTTKTETKTDVQGKGEYCKTNAMDKACLGEGSGSFSGTCGAAPACSGDAVMCAIAASTFETKCAFALPEGTDTISEIAAYAASKLKTGSQLAGLPGSETVDVGSSKFDQTNLLGSPAGMHDISVTVMGRSIVLPFSGVNVWLERFGLALQAVTFLVCAYIVTGQRSRA